MDKQQAIEQLKQFKEEYLVSRDKILEIWNFFKFNIDEKKYTTLVNNAPVTILRSEFWDYINSTDIRNLCKKPKEQSEIDVSDEQATPTDYTKLRKECVTAKHKLNFERNLFNKKLKEHIHVETGIFGAEMKVELINDGPVTIMLDSDEIIKK